jgi:hypothetical protein
MLTLARNVINGIVKLSTNSMETTEVAGVLSFEERLGFYDALEDYLVRGSKVSVLVDVNSLPGRSSALWWMLYHAENWKDFDRLLRRMTSSLDGESKLTQLRLGVSDALSDLVHWLLSISDVGYRIDSIGRYTISVRLDGTSLCVDFIPLED